ncbi:MAG: CHAT domain-containing protein [Lewinellaceae bacterium]|nr:CHAT domain-containing protein [Lewinellaceae bacterium]
MKSWLFLALWAAPVLAAAQTDTPESVVQAVDSLIQASKALTSGKDFDGALEINETAERLALDQLGRWSDPYGYACFNHGRILHFKGDYPEAEKWYLEGLDIYKNLEGPPLPGHGKCLNNLALLYRRTFQYEKAESLYQEVLALAGKIRDQTSEDFASCQHSMAILFSDMGRWNQAEALYRGALSQYEKVFGKEDPKYIRCQNGLAVLYMDMGANERAEQLYEEIIQIQESVIGKDHYEYALSLHNLAGLYFQMGLYQKAEPLYLSAKEIWEKTLGKEDPYYAMCLDNLASLYLQMSSFAKAESLYRESLEITKNTSGTDRPEFAWNLVHLGILYKRQGLFEEAEPYFLQAKTIYAQLLGTNHPDYAMCLNNLGDLYLEWGRYDQAEASLLEGSGIVKNAFGPRHPDYLTGLQSFSRLYAAMGNQEKAADYFVQAADLQRSFLSRAVRHLSEKELDQYQDKFEESQARLLSFAFLTQPTPLPLLEACYENALFLKGFLLHSSSQIRTLALSNESSAEKYYLLRSYEEMLAAEYAKPSTERTGEDQLEEKVNALEKDLASTVAGFGDALQQVHWQEVQRALRPGEAAIEFVHFRYFTTAATDSLLYAALLLKPEATSPQWISLFEEKDLEKLLLPSDERRADYVNHLYTLPDRGLQPVADPMPTLYQLIWQPIEKELKGVATIYFSPTGLLHRLDLGAIPVPHPGNAPWTEDQTLASQYRLIQLGSTRQLVIPSAWKPAGQDALLFGGVQYDVDTTNQKTEEIPLASRSNRGGVTRWNYLRWTDKEVASLAPILESKNIHTTTLRASEASERAFKTIGKGQPSPRILHLATHGFFFPEPDVLSEEGGSEGESTFKRSEHPMIRSGLILAGGNYAWTTGLPLRPGMEDGILTAYEISQMDLSHTELVVLSACETGLGAIKGNEGVYGLQRAFKIAGAKYLIMSLWQVPDQETQVFMTTFYQNWLEEELDIPAAFRATQLQMRERFLNPYAWAGFVLVE